MVHRTLYQAAGLCHSDDAGADSLVGIISYGRLSIREYPDIERAVVTVKTTYRGADAKIVKSQVTKILEDSLAGIEDIDFMSSISRPEASQVSVTFKLDRDPNSGAADVREGRAYQGQAAGGNRGAGYPKGRSRRGPIMYLAFTSDRHSPPEISDHASRYVKDRLQVLDGVAEVQIFGERRYSMRIWLHPDKLAAYSLTSQDIVEALRLQNVEVPAGRIESIGREFSILSETDLKTTEQFNNLVIKRVTDHLVRLADVGHAEIGPQDTRRVVRYNGETAIAMGVVKQATANPLDVSKAVYAALPDVQKSLPEGMRVSIAYDSTVYINKSMKNVQETILEAVVLVILIIFFFLRSLRAVMVPLVTIPVSLVGACAMMFFFGFSINTLTLLSMVLAIGLVVDDAIVMLENIHRHIEEGMAPLQAAIAGSREIGFAIVAMTLTLVAVYIPVGFR